MDSQPRQFFYEFGPFRVDPLKRLLLCDGRPVPLKAKAFDTLLTLVRHSGQDLDKDELMRTVWPDTIVEENNLTQCVSMLRKALGESKSDHRYIVTIPGHGYRFVPSVKEVCDDQARDAGVPLRIDAAPPRRAEEVETDTSSASPNGAAPSETAGVVELPAPNPNGDAAPRHISDAANVPIDVLPRRRVALVRTRAIILLLLGITLAALFYWWLTHRSQPTPPPPPGSIAVLPFEPMGMPASDQYLGLSMADALITKLSNIRAITVRPASAVAKFANRKTDLVAVGRELNVDFVLEGSIQRVDDHIRVSVRLVSVRENSPNWGRSFDEQLTDILHVQDSISARVAEALELELTGEEQRRLAKRDTENAEAYELYLKGRAAWNKRNEEGLNESIVYFNQAITKDKGFALAYAGLADAHSVIGFYQFGHQPPAESFKKAKAAALEAIALDRTLAEAHASLAISVSDVDDDEEQADREFSLAIALNPNYATAHHWYSDFLAMMGKHTLAMSEIRRALELDPTSPVINATLGERFYDVRQYDEAIRQLRKTLEKDSDFGPAHYLLGLALEQKGSYEEAIAELDKACQLSGNSPWMVSALGHTLALAGKRDEAQRVLERLRELSKDRYVTPYDFAVVYQGLGQPEQVIKQLRKMPRGKDWRKLQDDPRMDGLRQDARFRELYQP